MLVGNKRGSSTLGYLVVVVAIVLTIQLGLGVDLLSTVKTKVTDGIQIILEKGYDLCEYVKFDQIKAAGIKLSEKSWDAFLQICDRLVLNFGQVKVYADIEARVMFVYGDSSQQEVYYATF
jgi:hypothetical protein